MYRIFCESYDNFKNLFQEKSVRLKNVEPLDLIVDINKYREEEKKKSEIYKKLCDLLKFMAENIAIYPRFKAFLWTLEARGIVPQEYNVAKQEEIEEQTKLVNSFLKLAYWY